VNHGEAFRARKVPLPGTGYFFGSGGSGGSLHSIAPGTLKACEKPTTGCPICCPAMARKRREPPRSGRRRFHSRPLSAAPARQADRRTGTNPDLEIIEQLLQPRLSHFAVDNQADDAVWVLLRRPSTIGSYFRRADARSDELQRRCAGHTVTVGPQERRAGMLGRPRRCAATRPGPASRVFPRARAGDR
jgi:hypothetical protein